MAERKKWTEDEAERLILTLQAERPELWDVYTRGETREEAVDPEVTAWIRMTMRRLFPHPSPDERTDLFILFRRIMWKRLGLRI